jgi:hypothetical protein
MAEPAPPRPLADHKWFKLWRKNFGKSWAKVFKALDIATPVPNYGLSQNFRDWEDGKGSRPQVLTAKNFATFRDSHPLPPEVEARVTFSPSPGQQKPSAEPTPTLVRSASQGSGYVYLYVSSFQLPDSETEAFSQFVDAALYVGKGVGARGTWHQGIRETALSQLLQSGMNYHYVLFLDLDLEERNMLERKLIVALLERGKHLWGPPPHNCAAQHGPKCLCNKVMGENATLNPTHPFFVKTPQQLLRCAYYMFRGQTFDGSFASYNSELLALVPRDSPLDFSGNAPTPPQAEPTEEHASSGSLSPPTTSQGTPTIPSPAPSQSTPDLSASTVQEHLSALTLQEPITTESKPAALFPAPAQAVAPAPAVAPAAPKPSAPKPSPVVKPAAK